VRGGLDQTARGEYAELVVDSCRSERVYSRPTASAGGLFLWTCFPTEFTRYCFSVQADGIRWEVGLRFSQFVDFDSALRTHFSKEELEGVGTLPEKTFIHSNGSPNLIEQRMGKLQAYLSSLATSPTILQSGLVRDFLKFPEENALLLDSVSKAAFTPGAFAVCRVCRMALQTHKDDLDAGMCAVCSRHGAFMGEAVD